MLRSTLTHGYCSRFLHHRSVSTLHPLAIAFNAKPKQKLRHSFSFAKVGLFANERVKSAEDLYLAESRLTSDIELLVREALAPTRTRKLVHVFDDLSDSICRVADLTEFLRIAHPNQKYISAAEEVHGRIAEQVEQLNTNLDLYRCLKSVFDQKRDKNDETLDEVECRVAELLLFDFEQSGIHLDAERRSKFIAYNNNVLNLSTFFLQNCHEPVFVESNNVSSSVGNIFPRQDGKVVVAGLYADSDREEVRQEGFRLFLSANPKMEEALGSMIANRHRLATVAGFSSYSERANRGMLLETPAAVSHFLETLSTRLRPLADRDLARMRAYKSQVSSKPLAIWDVPYITARLKAERLKMTSPAAYLSLGNCMAALDHVLGALFGLHLRVEETLPGEIWHEDVYKVAVHDDKGGVLGVVYCDFFQRAHKLLHDCHFTIRCGRLLPSGSYQSPIVVVHLNLPRPMGSTPSLLSTGMVENLFHEFGHAIHSMLARTRFQHVAGTRCATDFAEVPSQFLEYYAFLPSLLKEFMRHHSTNEPLPDSVADSLGRSRKFLAASEMQLQVLYSLLDQRLHGVHPLDKSISAVADELHDSFYFLPHAPGTAWHLRFSHLVSYGARYHAYLVSKAVAAMLWKRQFARDPLSRASGERYRSQMLQHGGQFSTDKLVNFMFGQTVTSQDLINALMDEVGQFYEEREQER